MHNKEQPRDVRDCNNLSWEDSLPLQTPTIVSRCGLDWLIRGWSFAAFVIPSVCMDCVREDRHRTPEDRQLNNKPSNISWEEKDDLVEAVFA